MIIVRYAGKSALLVVCLLWLLSGCSDTIRVTNSGPDGSTTWKIRIETVSDALLGHYVQVNVMLDSAREAMGAFDFLITYDTSALTLAGAELGSYLHDCGWEYFTYRDELNNDSAHGFLRLVGIYDVSNGPSLPISDSLAAAGHSVVSLKFYVTANRNMECKSFPIGFYWANCGDNTVVAADYSLYGVNRYVYDTTGTRIDDYASAFPSYTGVPDDSCLAEKSIEPRRAIDFVNGRVSTTGGGCDEPDVQGDLNVNGIANEIADANMFIAYFFSGLSVFGQHIEASIFASDVNRDGMTLTLADLVYLIRIIVGDAGPFQPPQLTVVATVNMENGTVTVESPVAVGAVWLVFQIDPNDTLSLENLTNLNVSQAIQGDELRVLIYNIGSRLIPAGKVGVLNIRHGEATLIYAEVAPYEGYQIKTVFRPYP
jgi:hypothetical protein